ncbi:MAG: hypothetical protein LBF88_13910 [Planctomycetaceae bacterium]|nr:hypothetical protein [Planctomycetaceae bacterium]
MFRRNIRLRRWTVGNTDCRRKPNSRNFSTKDCLPFLRLRRDRVPTSCRILYNYYTLLYQ